MAKKKHKSNKGPPAPKVRLSQCMIVKNEEHNIEKALSWGKGIVCEQIVVDTGSSDRTVEIAGKMGARVLHFEWIGDFAAAKNFAIEQAQGNWLAFLDADEYFPPQDASKLLPILKQVENNPAMKAKCLAIGCPMHQLDDEGKTRGINVQVRLFRNTAKVRYVGRIHEELSIGAPDIIRTEDIKIMHTGYSDSAYLSSDKLGRNIAMLRAELEENPDNLRMKMYLADSLIAYASTANDEKAKDEARALYIEVAKGGGSLDPEYRKTALRYLMSLYSKTAEADTELEGICEQGYKDFPDDHSIACLYAAILNNKGRYGEALELLEELEKKQNNLGSRALTFSVRDMIDIYTQMVYAAQGLGDLPIMCDYTAMMLALDKTNVNVLCNYIKLLLRQHGAYETVVEMLGVLYDMKSEADVAIIKAAERELGIRN